MEKYNKPEMEILELDILDVIQASGIEYKPGTGNGEDSSGDYEWGTPASYFGN